ncbi:hypothetical protein [Saccharicrinis aurantiacus]|uniref:hypothetical protein n=1 Tax=Saccharicrinis aurantiacus TaxID=1849719 RepID=UPI0024907D57|nr:hypothetical protein [Saccharicrinis aurantiacus]
MKKLNIYILLFSLITMFSCKDEYEQPFPVSDVKWYTSMPGALEYFAQEGEIIGFMDASVGELSHEWRIQEGANFLLKEADQGDSLELFLDTEKGLVSDDKGVRVYFGKSGRTTVSLYNEFPDSVAFNGARPIYSKMNAEGNWVIDTSFVVDVYAPVQPAFKVCRVIEGTDGSVSAGEVLVEVSREDTVNVENSDTWKSVDVQVGERLMFIDLTKEENPEFKQPDSRTWTIRNNTEPDVKTDSVALVYFNVYGYKTTGLGSLKVERNITGAPKGSGQKPIPLKLQVVQSEKDFTYADGAVWTGQKTLAFNVTGEVASLGGAPENGFTVTVENSKLGTSPVVIPVTGVSVDPSNATRISLELGAEIYGDDMIKVSFDAAGTNILSKDERQLISFTPQVVSIPAGSDNELTDDGKYSGYEDGNGNPQTGFVNQYWVGAQDPANAEWSRVETKQFEGEASMMYNGTLTPLRPNLGWMQMQQSVDLAPGAYEVSHKIYIEPGSTIQKIRSYVSPKTGGWPTEVAFEWDLSEVKQGEWVTIKSIANFPNQIGGSSTEQYRYQFSIYASDNPGVPTTDMQTFYLDAMGIAAVDAGIRP